MIRVFIYFVVLIGLSACDVNKQINEIKTLGKCEFAIASIEKIEVGGNDLKGIVQKGEINLANVPALALGFLSRNIPLKTNFILKITNPTENKAAINQFDYILLINQQQLVEGTIYDKIEVLPDQDVFVPLEFSFNIYEFLANEAIRKDIQEFIKASRSSETKTAHLTIKIKPGILIGKQLIKYPSFISIEKTLNNNVFLNK